MSILVVGGAGFIGSVLVKKMLQDNMDIIDQNTLNAVGNVLTHILYKESAGIL